MPPPDHSSGSVAVRPYLAVGHAVRDVRHDLSRTAWPTGLTDWPREAAASSTTSLRSEGRGTLNHGIRGIRANPFPP
jgi:hypothetical protein